MTHQHFGQVLLDFFILKHKHLFSTTKNTIHHMFLHVTFPVTSKYKGWKTLEGREAIRSYFVDMFLINCQKGQESACYTFGLS